ncbi:uncharacterized protein K452DRAFT_284491 [Aplosporella prunicola CBS 121167]|uniref:Secreted protein n=1 Tax=Aplosporella prunicola CBS 121167 TaxID=1176127 RepID=A0A6A6BLX3_9PEZI|nr:uncharacterized protein K452DRAFT_284491 [Aplosporella prunicola CBS 121167]KAF2145109.1 hypothetical protein K452DRAFT_284491 [Aplosporella prunicola CBS 121167]
MGVGAPTLLLLMPLRLSHSPQPTSPPRRRVEHFARSVGIGTHRRVGHGRCTRLSAPPSMSFAFYNIIQYCSQK